MVSSLHEFTFVIMGPQYWPVGLSRDARDPQGYI